MSQLQTVLDALEPCLQMEDGSIDVDIMQAITIVKQMMQAEPVAWSVWSPDGTCLSVYRRWGW